MAWFYNLRMEIKLLGARSDEIGAIVETIEEIASQTNLPAQVAQVSASAASMMELAKMLQPVVA